MSRTRVRRRRTALFLALATLGAVWAGPLRPAAAERPTGASSPAGAAPRHAAHLADPRSYVVAPGDTLWGIAVRLRPGGDPRPLVDAIQEANHLDPGALRPGQVLDIPPV
jgi:nucleoid-associated protein YgaU